MNRVCLCVGNERNRYGQIARRKFYKSFSAKLVATLYLALLSIMSFADTETVGGITWKYTVTSGKATIMGSQTGVSAIPVTTEGDIVVPCELGGCPVTGIGDWAFRDCTKLT